MLLDTPICEHGWQAPKFSLKDAGGKSYHFGELMGEKGLLIAFICNHCPYVKAIIERFVSDANELETIGINTVAIMPNDYANYPDDSPEKMKEFAALHQFNFPYLLDESQEVAKAYDAVCTPDFFGLNAEGGLHYRGRIDDAKMQQSERKTAELLDAMTLIANSGQGPKKQNPSMGCSIKWKSK